MISGGIFDAEREKSAIETARRNVAGLIDVMTQQYLVECQCLVGFALEGFGTGESAPVRQQLLEIVLVSLFNSFLVFNFAQL